MATRGDDRKNLLELKKQDYNHVGIHNSLYFP